MDPALPPYMIVVADLHGVSGQKILDELPQEARFEISILFATLMHDPYGLSSRYAPDQGEFWRGAVFGDGHGLVKFMVSDQHRRIVITNITWFG